MHCVGLTGNIASGKSTVADLFAQKGIKVISADAISRMLTQPGQPALKAIEQHFGHESIQADGSLDRKLLRQIIFKDAKERKWLEQLLHPLIRQEIQKEVALAQGAYCIIEIPLLPDKKKHPYLSEILYVRAPQETQITRLMKRDKCSRANALAILEVQANDNEHMKIADHILVNDGTLQDLKSKVDAFDKIFKNK